MEATIWTGRPSWKGYLFTIGFSSLIFSIGCLRMLFTSSQNTYAFILNTIFIVIGFFYIIKAIIGKYRANYEISTTRIIGRYGILSTVTVEMDIRYIRTINVSQSLFQKIVGTGDIEFASMTGSMNDIYLHNINEPCKVKEIIHKCKEYALKN